MSNVKIKDRIGEKVLVYSKFFGGSNDKFIVYVGILVGFGDKFIILKNCEAYIYQVKDDGNAVKLGLMYKIPLTVISWGVISNVSFLEG